MRSPALFLTLVGTTAALASSAAHAADATVVVSTTPGTALSLRLSSNDVWSGLLAQSPAAQSFFSALALPLVRIHVGDDGSPVAMPEVVKGRWSLDALDRLVRDVKATGQEPLLNIKFAPDWQWTCTKQQGVGEVRDQSFGEYGDYLARLVSYYNRGYLITEDGRRIANPYGVRDRVTYWEPWNEPDLDNETPCAPSSGVALTPSQYVRMWEAVTSRMLAVDPTLRFVGPATAGGQFGADVGRADDYFTPLMAQPVKPSAISFHGYGYWDNAASDATILHGDSSGAGGIPSIVEAAAALHRAYPSTPIWIDEMNVNADWGADPRGRPWGALAAAWWGTAYAELAPVGVTLVDQFDLIDGPQFGLLDDQNGRPRLPYWIVKSLNAAFPAGCRRLSATSSDSALAVLAARCAGGTTVVLVADAAVDPAARLGGRGLPRRVEVRFGGRVKRCGLLMIDRQTSSARGPVWQTAPRASAASVRISFPGYGLALLKTAGG